MDYVIMDGSFMQDFKQVESRIRFEAIVEKAKSKAISTIASRVENAGDIATLCRLGVNFIQGYYLQEPEDIINDDVLLPE
jgi:EAL domain-containing protein (putative c-di-GMP-specific phosphodiesterase class I)